MFPVSFLSDRAALFVIDVNAPHHTSPYLRFLQTESILRVFSQCNVKLDNMIMFGPPASPKPPLLKFSTCGSVSKSTCVTCSSDVRTTESHPSSLRRVLHFIVTIFRLRSCLEHG